MLPAPKSYYPRLAGNPCRTFLPNDFRTYNTSIMQGNPSFVEDVYRSARKECLEHALALEAAGINYAIQERPDGYAIVVATQDAAKARSEIEAYAQENPAELFATPYVPPRANGWAGVVGYTAVLALITILQHHGIFARDWRGAGRLNAGLIRQGEMWRTVTALSLHLDLVHLVGNIAIGGLVGLFAGQLLGSGLAWISILLAGAFGNLLSASFRPASYAAIGASTAVFAALGILAAYEWVRRRQTRASMFVRYAPIVGGVVLLSYLGTGCERTDVLSHIAGFSSGLLLGAIYAKLGSRIMFGSGVQFLLGIGAVAILSLAWILALMRKT